jgi:hypothetical protein
MAKVLEIKRIPDYNRFMSSDFRIQEKDKFIVIEDQDRFYKLKNVRNKRIVTLLKNYFINEETNVLDKKKIQYD